MERSLPEPDCHGQSKRRLRKVLTGFFVIAKNWKQPRCPSMGEWINHGISILVPLFGLLFSNKKELLIHATTWMELKGIMLRKKKLISKGCCMIPFL